jgi:Tfp pilus assembly protein PilW
MVIAMRPLSSPRRHSRGVSIAEGLMVMVIGGLLLSVLPGYYLTYVRIWQRETGRLGAVQRTDFALERIENEIRSARSVALSYDGSSLTLTMPLRAYDATLGRPVNVLDEVTGFLADGDQIIYYFLQDPDGTGSSGGALCRTVHPAGGTEGDPKVVTQQIYPHLNPRGSGGGDPAPIFAYDSPQRIITVTATAAEPLPSSGTFAPTQLEPTCRRCGSELIRVPTEDNLAGEIQCPQCGDDARPTAEIVTYQTRFRVRNQ